MLGMSDHRFHALVAQERVESLRATMLASRHRPRQQRVEEPKEAGQMPPRLEHCSAALERPRAA